MFWGILTLGLLFCASVNSRSVGQEEPKTGPAVDEPIDTGIYKNFKSVNTRFIKN
jgi:hypothetical protein